MSASHILFLGPDKTGSTWFHSVFSSSSEVSAPPAKDPFYFDRHYGRGALWYESLFPASGDHRIDVSHDYLFSDKAAQRIMQDLDRDSTQLVVGVRHPIDRAHSAWRYMQSQGRIGIKNKFTESLREVPELLDHGDYGLHLERWNGWSDRVVLLNFSELKRDSEAELRRLATALGIDHTSISETPSNVVNPARTARHPTAVRASRLVARQLRSKGALGVVQRVKDSEVTRRLLFSGSPPPTASPEELAGAEAMYESELLASASRANEIVPSPIWSDLV